MPVAAITTVPLHSISKHGSLQCGAQPDIDRPFEKPLDMVTSSKVFINGTETLRTTYTSVATKVVDPALQLLNAFCLYRSAMIEWLLWNF
ncbi:hypothetical protein HDV63DRAFT_367774 [Trichoderma sp. SZMC 28014]